MRRAILPWLVAFGIAVLGGVGAVVALNATVFNAGGFVQVYMDALARGDVSEALTLPGVHPARTAATGAATGAATDEPSAALLRDGTLTGLRNIRITGDEERGAAHLITADWTSPHGSGTTTFQVKRVGTRFGLFPEWGFAVSPMATIALTVENDARFTMNGVAEVSQLHASLPVDYAVLVPGAYSFASRTRYLGAPTDVVLADTVNQRLVGTVATRANAAFVKTVSTLVNSQLRECATQQVLFPTGCSFGQSVNDRVSGVPKWSIVVPPLIAIVPGTEFGGWAIPSTPGTAHLTVNVTSLFDGTSSEFSQDVPFVLQGDITLGSDDSISVTLN